MKPIKNRVAGRIVKTPKKTNPSKEQRKKNLGSWKQEIRGL